MQLRVYIIMVIILGVVWSCSKAPLPPEPDETAAKTEFGNVYLTTVNETGQQIDQANLFFNGEFVGETPIFVDSVSLGTHTLRVQKNGYEIYSEMITVQNGLTINREVILHELPLNTGQLFLTVNRDSANTTITNSLNEIVKQTFSREMSITLDVGGYFIRCEKPGYALVNKAIKVLLDSTTVENIELAELANAELPQIAITIPEKGLVQQPVLFAWESENAEKVDIDYIENPGLNGKREVIFKAPGVHYIRAIAYNAAGQCTIVDSVLIEAVSNQSPEIKLSFNPQKIFVNDVTTIIWHSVNATKVVVDYVPQPELNGQWQTVFTNSGSIIVHAYAYGPGGEAQDCDTLFVQQTTEPAPNIQVTVMPKRLSIGQKATISWHSENASTVDVDFVPNPGKNGQWQTQFSTTGEIVINAYAYGNGDQAYDADTVFVDEALPPSLEFSATPKDVAFGKPVKLQWRSNGSQVIIDYGVGIRGPIGNEEIIFQNPGKKTITAVAYGQNRLMTIKTDTVIVREPSQPELPVLSLSVVDSVELGQPALVEWHSMNATAVDIDYVQNAGLNGKTEVFFNFPGERIVAATAYNNAGQTTVYDTVVVVMGNVSNQIEPIFVSSGAKVCAIHPTGVPVKDAGELNIKTAGYYRVTACVWYDSGDEQKNESFFITMIDEKGIEYNPMDANAGEHKVVPDDPGSPHVSERDAGLFLLPAGKQVIQLSHYFVIADQYPQFVVNGPIDDAESVQIFYFKFEYIREAGIAHLFAF